MEVGIYELPKGYLSASAIDTLLKCPKMYEFKYIENRTKPQNKMLAMGSITHAAFETYYNDVLEHKNEERLTGKQMVELTMDDVMPTWFEEKETDIKPEEKEEIEEVVPNIVENYVDCVGSTITPLGVEQEIDFTMECQVPMKAYLDLVRVVDDGKGLVDYKISGRAWQMSRLQNSLQFMLYTYLTGISDVQIQNIVKPSSGKKVVMNRQYADKDKGSTGTYQFTAGSSLHILGHTFENNQKEYLEDLVQRCAELITTGIFIPTQPGNWWCSSIWCDFWHLCRGKRV